MFDRKRYLAWGLLVLSACGSDANAKRAQPDAGEPADAGVQDQTDSGLMIQEQECEIDEAAGEVPYVQRIGCRKDFDALASAPVDVTLPGSRSLKLVLDQADGDALYFQNSVSYPIHYQFVSAHLSGDGLPLVPSLAQFNQTEYYAASRRFVLGAVTYYEEPDVWAFELSPYDTASAAMIEKVFAKLRTAAYFGPAVRFHPTSSAVKAEAEKLSPEIRRVSTDELYAGTTYQPLTLGRSMGRLHFMRASELATAYVSFRDILVLDEVPNDISVVSGLITEQFQTPLSHVNVLSQNRGTPNMGLRGATSHERLRALEGKWVELTVESSAWSVREVSVGEADAWWEAHRPEPVELPPLDLAVTGLWDVQDVVVEGALPLREAIKAAVPAFGGKVAHYSVLLNTPELPVRPAFAVPVSHYDSFMRDNGFYARVEALLADPAFQADPAVRDLELAKLRADMALAPVDQALQDAIKAKWDRDFPGVSLRFRTSTNSEDLEGFPCAGCYESHTGTLGDWVDVLDAIRDTWASIWLFRTFEERSYYGVDHMSVGMALLVHPNFPDEEANGVALTANPFDVSGLEPAFYVNVQFGGEAEVVHPPPGVSSDEFLYFFEQPNQPRSFLSHSNLVAQGETVISARQTHELGTALSLIHQRFSPAYGEASGNTGWYAMDIEFKFDDAGGAESKLFIKQARPHPGRGSVQAE